MIRLLNVYTFRTKEFHENASCPKYVALSHTWDPNPENEVLLQDLYNGQARSKKGYRKVRKCCRQAASDGFTHVWIDTCCINRESPEELIRSINSMFGWYSKSAVCYAYLADVDVADATQETSLQQSRWFRRGWTLQELIAPKEVIFFSGEWMKFGTRSSLQDQIEDITGIDHEALSGRDLREYSIAQRMSWACGRETSKVEDIAYCLLGIFHIKLNLNYGEGEKAFQRLQEEIVRRSDDTSIFAWTPSRLGETNGIFAVSPESFRETSQIRRGTSAFFAPKFSLLHRQLSISLFLMPCAADVYFAILGCEQGNSDTLVGIFLKPLDNRGVFSRVLYKNRTIGTTSSKVAQDFLTTKQGGDLPREIMVFIHPKLIELHPPPPMYGFELHRSRHFTHDFEPKIVRRVFSRTSPKSDETTLEIPDGKHGTAGVVAFFNRKGALKLVMKFGFDADFVPVFLVGNELFPNRRLPLLSETMNEGELQMILDDSWIFTFSDAEKKAGADRPVLRHRTDCSADRRRFYYTYRQTACAHTVAIDALKLRVHVAREPHPPFHRWRVRVKDAADRDAWARAPAAGDDHHHLRTGSAVRGLVVDLFARATQSPRPPASRADDADEVELANERAYSLTSRGSQPDRPRLLHALRKVSPPAVVRSMQIQESI